MRILLAPVLFAHVSMLHTCNAALEPFFSAAATQFILGQQVPFSLWLSLAPVVIGNSQFDPLILITSIFFTGLNNTYYLNCTFLSILIIGYKLIRHTLLAHPLWSHEITRCFNGIPYWAFIQLDWLHQCHDIKHLIHLQEHLFQESYGLCFFCFNLLARYDLLYYAMDSCLNYCANRFWHCRLTWIAPTCMLTSQ